MRRRHYRLSGRAQLVLITLQQGWTIWHHHDAGVTFVYPSDPYAPVQQIMGIAASVFHELRAHHLLTRAGMITDPWGSVQIYHLTEQKGTTHDRTNDHRLGSSR